jgi:hypothetical protein
MTSSTDVGTSKDGGGEEEERKREKREERREEGPTGREVPTAATGRFGRLDMANRLAPVALPREGRAARHASLSELGRRESVHESRLSSSETLGQGG